MLTRLAMWWLRRQLNKDQALALAWHCNLAVSAQDEGVAWAKSQLIAGRFMQLAFKTNTAELPQIAPFLKDKT